MARRLLFHSCVSARMKKRVRDAKEQKEDRDGGFTQCPVCLEDTVVNPIFPFDCGHPVCSKCDKELFCRADDRCPMCRKARLQDSVDAHCASLNISNEMQRREDAIAQRRNEETAQSGLIFFQLQGMVEVDATDFMVQEDTSRDSPSGDLVRVHHYHALRDSNVSHAISALVNAWHVPLSEFYTQVHRQNVSP